MKKFLQILFAVFVSVPILILILWVFTEYWPWPELLPLKFSSRGIEAVAVESGDFVDVMLNSIGISSFVAIASTVIGILSSRALSNESMRFKGGFSFIVILPILIPAVSFGMGLHYIFLKWGLANTIIGIIIAHLMLSLPYSTLILIDGMKALGTRYEEQARVLGAGAVRAFRRTTLPLLTMPIITSFIMAYIVSFSQYFITLLIGGGLIKTYSVVMIPYIQGGQRNVAAAYSLVFLGISYVVFAAVFLATSSMRKRAKGGLY